MLFLCCCCCFLVYFAISAGGLVWYYLDKSYFNHHPDFYKNLEKIVLIGCAIFCFFLAGLYTRYIIPMVRMYYGIANNKLMTNNAIPYFSATGTATGTGTAAAQAVTPNINPSMNPNPNSHSRFGNNSNIRHTKNLSYSSFLTRNLGGIGAKQLFNLKSKSFDYRPVAIMSGHHGSSGHYTAAGSSNSLNIDLSGTIDHSTSHNYPNNNVTNNNGNYANTYNQPNAIDQQQQYMQGQFTQQQQQIAKSYGMNASCSLNESISNGARNSNSTASNSNNNNNNNNININMQAPAAMALHESFQHYLNPNMNSNNKQQSLYRQTKSHSLHGPNNVNNINQMQQHQHQQQQFMHLSLVQQYHNHNYNNYNNYNYNHNYNYNPQQYQNQNQQRGNNYNSNNQNSSYLKAHLLEQQAQNQLAHSFIYNSNGGVSRNFVNPNHDEIETISHSSLPSVITGSATIRSLSDDDEEEEETIYSITHATNDVEQLPSAHNNNSNNNGLSIVPNIDISRETPPTQPMRTATIQSNKSISISSTIPTPMPNNLVKVPNATALDETFIYGTNGKRNKNDNKSSTTTQKKAGSAKLATKNRQHTSMSTSEEILGIRNAENINTISNVLSPIPGEDVKFNHQLAMASQMHVTKSIGFEFTRKFGRQPERVTVNKISNDKRQHMRPRSNSVDSGLDLASQSLTNDNLNSVGIVNNVRNGVLNRFATTTKIVKKSKKQASDDVAVDAPVVDVNHNRKQKNKSSSIFGLHSSINSFLSQKKSSSQLSDDITRNSQTATSRMESVLSDRDNESSKKKSFGIFSRTRHKSLTNVKNPAINSVHSSADELDNINDNNSNDTRCNEISEKRYKQQHSHSISSSAVSESQLSPNNQTPENERQTHDHTPESNINNFYYANQHSLDMSTNSPKMVAIHDVTTNLDSSIAIGITKANNNNNHNNRRNKNVKHSSMHVQNTKINNDNVGNREASLSDSGLTYSNAEQKLANRPKSALSRLFGSPNTDKTTNTYKSTSGTRTKTDTTRTHQTQTQTQTRTQTSTAAAYGNHTTTNTTGMAQSGVTIKTQNETQTQAIRQQRQRRETVICDYAWFNCCRIIISLTLSLLYIVFCCCVWSLICGINICDNDEEEEEEEEENYRIDPSAYHPRKPFVIPNANVPSAANFGGMNYGNGYMLTNGMTQQHHHQQYVQQYKQQQRGIGPIIMSPDKANAVGAITAANIGKDGGGGVGVVVDDSGSGNINDEINGGAGYQVFAMSPQHQILGRGGNGEMNNLMIKKNQYNNYNYNYNYNSNYGFNYTIMGNNNNANILNYDFHGRMNIIASMKRTWIMAIYCLITFMARAIFLLVVIKLPRLLEGYPVTNTVYFVLFEISPLFCMLMIYHRSTVYLKQGGMFGMS